MTKLLAIRLKPNEYLKQSLKDFAIQQNIQAGFIQEFSPKLKPQKYHIFVQIVSHQSP
jgi:hypothetical protein